MTWPKSRCRSWSTGSLDLRRPDRLAGEGNLAVGWTRRRVGRRDIDDQVSFERYVRERGRALARTGAFQLGDPQLGEDLAQEVLAALSLRW